MNKSELEIWEKLAEDDVKQAKELDSLGNLYLLTMIKNLRQILSNENPFALVTADIRYRTFVVKILSEAKKQELPNYENLLARVLLGK